MTSGNVPEIGDPALVDYAGEQANARRALQARIDAALEELAACHGQAADRARAFLNGKTPWPMPGDPITGEDRINGGEVTGTFTAVIGLEKNYQVITPMGQRLIKHGTARAALLGDTEGTSP